MVLLEEKKFDEDQKNPVNDSISGKMHAKICLGQMLRLVTALNHSILDIERHLLAL